MLDIIIAIPSVRTLDNITHIFGESQLINENNLKFSLSANNIQTKEVEPDESITVVIIITIVSIGVAVFYLKGYKK